MNKSTLPYWATDANYAAGGDPWSGQPTKVVPSAGKIATGNIPATLHPAPEINYLQNLISGWCRWSAGLQIRNHTLADWSQVDSMYWLPVSTFPNILPGACCYDSTNKAFSAVNRNGNLIYSIEAGISFIPGTSPPGTIAYPGDHGINWTDENSGFITAGADLRSVLLAMGASFPTLANAVDIAADNNGTRIVTMDDGGATTDLVVRGSYTGWVAVTPATASQGWKAVDHDQSGLWAIGSSVGNINTSADGITWGAVTTGLAALIYPRCLKHSKDPNNPYWIALSVTLQSRSADGVTWSASAHGLPATPHELFYDALRQKWYVVLANGAVYASVNNGATWVSHSSGLTLPSGTAQYFGVSDGQGGLWVSASTYVSGTSPGNFRRTWCCIDDATWQEVGLPGGTNLDAAVGVAYGERFVTVGSAASWYSLRANDAI